MNENTTYTPLWDNKVGFYHGNNQGTGTAIQIGLEVIKSRNDLEKKKRNCMRIECARQTPGNPNHSQNPKFQFDWKNGHMVNLNAFEATDILCVLKGQKPTIGTDRYPFLKHPNSEIHFSRNKDYTHYLKIVADGNSYSFCLSIVESELLRSSLPIALFALTWGRNVWS